MSITVIIPTYNSVRFITSAVCSVFFQDYRPLEIIVVNDGSTDSTGSVLTQLLIWLTDQRRISPEQYSDITFKILNQENAGPSSARNAGLQIATGNYIAFLDADDVFPAGRLTHMVQLLEENTSVDMVFGLVQPVSDGADILNVGLGNGADYGHLSPSKVVKGVDYVVEEPKRMMGVHSGVYRIQTVSKIGFFDASLRYAEDIDWLMRAELIGSRMLFSDHVVLYHRKHKHSMTANTQELIKGQLQFIRKLRTSDQTIPDSFKIKWKLNHAPD